MVSNKASELRTASVDIQLTPRGKYYQSTDSSSVI